MIGTVILDGYVTWYDGPRQSYIPIGDTIMATKKKSAKKGAAKKASAKKSAAKKTNAPKGAKKAAARRSAQPQTKRAPVSTTMPPAPGSVPPMIGGMTDIAQTPPTSKPAA